MLPHYLGTIGGCPMVARGVATLKPLVATKQVASLCCLNLTLDLTVQPKCWPLPRASGMRRHSKCNSKLDKVLILLIKSVPQKLEPRINQTCCGTHK